METVWSSPISPVSLFFRIPFKTTLIKSDPQCDDKKERNFIA